MRNVISQNRVLELLVYDLASGKLCWRTSRGNQARAGEEAGTVRPDGYRRITIDRKRYYAHVLAWIYVYGDRDLPSQIDHKDANPRNNRIDNLRAATQSLNNANRHQFSNNTSGYKHVDYHRQTGKWRARIKINGQEFSLGLFTKAEEAHVAYAAAAHRYFGEFARVV